jgi:deferrochelatase/peroxidase EfeB
MSGHNKPGPVGTKRRSFLTGAAGAVGALGTAGAAQAKEDASRAAAAVRREGPALPFYGAHQNGIATKMQSHAYFAAFDLVTTEREEVASLLKAWTLAAARMTVGETAQPLDA